MNQLNGTVVGPFRKSSHSNTLNGILNCVEAAPTSDGGLAIRDSKNPGQPALFFNEKEIGTFFAGLKEFPTR